MLRYGLGLLACHTALIVAKARQTVDIGHLIDMLKWDLDCLSDHSPDVARAMAIINTQLGGEEDTANPGLVVQKLTEIRGYLRTVLFTTEKRRE
jgi:hypothetical protein